MGEAIDALGRNLEHLLRWIYPGILFLVLLGLSRPSNFKNLVSFFRDDSLVDPLWSLVAVGVVAGVVTYLFKTQVVDFAFTLLLHLIYKRNPIREEVGRMQRRWGQRRQQLNGYLDYAWGIQHATFITGFLMLLFWLFRHEGSAMDEMGYWVLALAIVILVASLVRYFLFGSAVRRLLLEDGGNLQEERAN